METHKKIGNEKRPFELVPAETRTRASAFLAKDAALDAIIVVVALPWHARFATAECLAPTATLWAELISLSTVLEAVEEDGV